jgi:hypothetical protein
METMEFNAAVREFHGFHGFHGLDAAQAAGRKSAGEADSRLGGLRSCQ